MSSSTRAAEAAKVLLRARAQKTASAPEGVSFRIESPTEAYEVQALVAAELGAVGAWKTGAAAPEAEPILAPVFGDLVWTSPARLPAKRFHRLGIEAEIGYRLCRDLPGRSQPYTRPEVIEAVDAILPTVEIVDSRLAACENLDPLWKLADNQINGGLVVGPASADWRRIDPITQPVRLALNDQVVAIGEVGNPAGDPLNLLQWLANNVGRHCGGLRAGQFVTTGSLTGLRFVAPGAHVRAELPGLGTVEVTFEL